MKDEILLSVTNIIVSDSITFHVGDTDFNIHREKLDEYLRGYGRKGKFNIVHTLAYLICEVERRYNELLSKGEIK